MGHYRQPLDFSTEALEQAKATLDKWYGALRPVQIKALNIELYQLPLDTVFYQLLRDDLNTPTAIAAVHEMVGGLNRATHSEEQTRMAKQVLFAGRELGVLYQDPEAWFKWQPANQSGPTDAEIEMQIAARLAARKAKNFAEADRIRDALAAQGVILQDGAGGTTWRRG